MSPLVAVTATTRLRDGIERVHLNQAYVAALEGAGLVPLLVPPLANPAAASDILERVDGLVLTGGEDVNPSRFGAPRHARTHDPHERRDATEIALTLEARRRSLPTLAICRGLQLVNVALGGTLVQDLPSERPAAGAHEGGPRDARVHEVTLTPDSRLSRLLGTTRVATNSSHHQAIDRVAPGLMVNALADDGVIEGIEAGGVAPADAAWWMLAVQWHPEELVATREPWDRTLFAAFAEACRGLPAERAVQAGREPAPHRA